MLLRYIISSDEQQKILHACHVDPTSGHMGRTRTLCRIKERYMWHGMVNDVQSMVSVVRHIHADNLFSHSDNINALR